MQQNKDLLGSRITDWEANQIGLPEDSEIIWGKLELALEASSSKKNHRFTYQTLAAASIITLLVSSVFLYEKFDKKTNRVASSKKSTSINSRLENVDEVILPSLAGKKIKNKNKKEDALFLNKDDEKIIELKSKNSLPQNIVSATKSNENLANEIAVKSNTDISNNIATPVEKIDSKKSNTIFWKSSKMGSKKTIQFPIVHVNELNKYSNSTKNTLAQFLTDEKPMSNFEVPPPNDVKNKWKINLHPSTIPVALTDHQ